MSRPQPTHEKIVGTNRGEIISWMSEFPQEIPGQLAAGLNRLGKDGGFNDIYTYYRIYPIPPGTIQGREIDPQEWIEAAGTTLRLTVEVRKRDADGVYRLYVVGRSAARCEAEASETLRFTFTEAHVRPSEVLTAADAIDLFQHYYDHHAIPDGWQLRETAGAVPISDPGPAPTSAPESDSSASVSDNVQAGMGTVAESVAETAPDMHAKAEPEKQDDQQRTEGI